tara:strand:- start:171 stop:809 length:639 start_codon:yes stop_codon:yes gene_type:complete
MQIGSTNTTTINLGVSGDTVNIPSGVTIANAGTATGFGLTNWSESSGNLLATNASYGIYLGVNSATAANLLNDYEEGTWTPGIDNTTSVAYDNRVGRYTKTGNLVFVECLLQWNSTSYSNNNYDFTITGLPFSPINIHYVGVPGSIATGASFNWNNTQSTSTTSSIAAAINENSVVHINVGASGENFTGSKVINNNNAQGIVSFGASYRTTA